MNDYTPIDCDLHDYVEIACLHGYRLLIELTDGHSFKARAITTRADSGEEFLVLDESEAESEVRLDRLKAITPLGEHPTFGRIVLVE